MADDRSRLAMAERGDEPQRVTHRIQQAVRREVVVAIGAPPRSAAIAALIGGNDVKPGAGQRRHDLTPGISDLGEAVQ